jgi:hypothetical protein
LCDVQDVENSLVWNSCDRLLSNSEVKQGGRFHNDLNRNGEEAINHYFPDQEFFNHEHVTIAGERLQDLGICSALRTFEQGGISIVARGD